MTIPPDAEAFIREIPGRSAFAARVVRQQAQWWAQSPWRAAVAADALATELREATGAARGEDAEAALMAGLRRVRDRRLLQIACRDLAGLASLDETLQSLSLLADLCVQRATGFAYEQLRTRYGTPRDARGSAVQPVVIAMGKLGGRELNLSSDIDLIFAHGAAGETDGSRPLPNEAFFVRLAQAVVRLLCQRTEEGFAYRVDTLLRPFGSSGPMSMHLEAMETYYREHGRDWERYALVKARVVAGDLSAGRSLLRRLQAFVYRRYLDFNAIGSLRKLKRLIEADVARRNCEADIKLGIGGIRELEFIVQSFQLVRGGQQRALRDRGLRRVLRYLGASGLLAAETAARLDECYVFLRRLENAIQFYDDQQTHALPREPEAREALVANLHMPDWAGLLDALQAVRADVHRQFQAIFRPEAGQVDAAVRRFMRNVWDEAPGDELCRQAIELGFDDRPDAVVEALRRLRGSRLLAALSEQTRERMAGMLTRLLEDCLDHPEPDLAAERSLAIVHTIAGRSTYLTLLDESPTARKQLVRLCAASPWITSLLIQSPALLGRLLDPEALYAVPTREQMKSELDGRLAQVPLGDVEGGMDALRRFRHETTLRIAAADVAGRLPLVEVSDRLTWCAEVVLAAALQRARTELASRHGEARNADGSPAGFGAIAYGKFGGIELGYGSDLDLVFVHDSDRPDEETTGERPIPNLQFLTRLAQRLVHWLSTLTAAGRAYEVDLELRPSGRSGLVVVSFDSFERYQREQAWVWEHQALTRARCVAGGVEIAERFARVRHACLCLPRDPERLRREVLDMRRRMREAREKRRAEHWDVKHARGGLVDLEFLTQYLLLREAHQHPGLTRWPDNWRQLESLAEAGVLLARERDDLIGLYRALRAWTHRRALQEKDTLAPDAVLSEERGRVVEHWERWFGPEPESDD
jgi:glutamate-ammonia-ligase adenylyltransferase